MTFGLALARRTFIPLLSKTGPDAGAPRGRGTSRGGLLSFVEGGLARLCLEAGYHLRLGSGLVAQLVRARA